MGRTIRGNYRTQTTVINLPDQFSRSLAGSFGVAVNTFSPMSRGPGDRGCQGVAGYGVNQFTGDTPPRVAVGAAVKPVADPSQHNLGIGSGVSGQPGLPNTGTTVVTPLAWMSMGQMTAGLGS